MTTSPGPGPNITTSVTPYTSPNAPPLSGSGGSGGANIPNNAAVPNLTMAWTSAPPFVSSGAGSGSGSQTYPPCPDISVSLSSLRDAENSMLSSSMAIVDAYDQLQTLFLDYQDWVYGQQATITYVSYSGGVEGDNTYGANTEPDAIQQQAQQFANGQDGQPGMNSQQAYALQTIGGVMALVGEFIALINAAGNAYATADTNSALPGVELKASADSDA